MSMSGVMRIEQSAAPVSVSLPCCPSSWISWTSYWIGYVLAVGPGAQNFMNQGVTGLFVLLAGAGAFFAAVIVCQRHMRLSLLANSFGSPAALVTSGPFRFSRNPIYAAFFAPIASLGFFNGWVALGVGAVYILAINLFIIRREEAELEGRFGGAYRGYKASVPRWLV